MPFVKSCFFFEYAFKNSCQQFTFRLEGMKASSTKQIDFLSVYLMNL